MAQGSVNQSDLIFRPKSNADKDALSEGIAADLDIQIVGLHRVAC
jgi:hypothetical protein